MAICVAMWISSCTYMPKICTQPWFFTMVFLHPSRWRGLLDYSTFLHVYLPKMSPPRWVHLQLMCTPVPESMETEVMNVQWMMVRLCTVVIIIVMEFSCIQCRYFHFFVVTLQVSNWDCRDWVAKMEFKSCQQGCMVDENKLPPGLNSKTDVACLQRLNISWLLT